LPPNNNTLTGNNAGQQAIGLAYLIGFKTIVLIGFDMDSTAKETHWHSEHKRPVVNKDIYNKTMIPSMNRMAIDLKQKNVEVFNINRESKLSCFPFSDLKQFL
jgi:uncharacterized Rossmann fold enzyme